MQSVFPPIAYQAIIIHDVIVKNPAIIPAINNNSVIAIRDIVWIYYRIMTEVITLYQNIIYENDVTSFLTP